MKSRPLRRMHVALPRAGLEEVAGLGVANAAPDGPRQSLGVYVGSRGHGEESDQEKEHEPEYPVTPEHCAAPFLRGDYGLTRGPGRPIDEVGQVSH